MWTGQNWDKVKNPKVDLENIKKEAKPFTDFFNTFFKEVSNDLNKEKIIDDFETEVSFNRYFRRKLNEMYLDNISPMLKNNPLFPIYDSNIFAFDVPHNVIYSNKRCFCSIELTLHTSNVFKKEKSFNEEKNCELYNSLIDISKTFSSSEFFNTNKYYSVYIRKK